jgi:hypothetical protein
MGRFLAAASGTLTAPLYVGPGDVRPGAMGWWGLRAYSAAAIGLNAVSVLRASDSTTQIFATIAGGGLDMVAIATFLSGTTGKVSKLWDQTGNGWHLTQATTANMPDFVQGDVRLGGALPSLHFIEASNYSMSSAATGLSATTCSIAAMACNDAVGTIGTKGIFEAGSSGIGWENNSRDTFFLRTASGAGVTSYDFCQHAVIASWSATNVASALVDTQLTTGLAPGTAAFTSPFVLGQLAGTGTFKGQGSIEEVGFWNSTLSTSDMYALSANMRAYWLRIKVAHEGPVALRCRHMQNLAGSTDAVNKYLMTRSAHIATDNLSSISVMIQNYASGGSGASFTASVEYPAGTFTQLLFSGGATLSHAASSNRGAFSDYVTIPGGIPNGATFWVRIFMNASTAASWFFLPFQNTFLGEATAVSASALTDMTMGGTITNSGAICYPPMAIVGLTSNATVLLIGDSIQQGFNDTEDSSNTATGHDARVGICARSLPAGTPFINAGIGSSLAPSTVNEPLTSLISKSSHVYCNYQANNFDSGAQTEQQVIANIKTLLQNCRPHQKVYQTTMTPDTNLTGSKVTNRAGFIADLRAGNTDLPILGIIDIASVLDPSNNNTYVGGATNGSGLHPTTAGYALIPPSGVVPVPVWP